MIGRPVSEGLFRRVNATGAAILLVAAVLPVVLSRATALRTTIPVVGWIGAVGCCMHALVDGVLRLLSVTGVHPAQLPEQFWLSFDRRSADVQDLLFNEPWFFIEGMLGAVVSFRSRRHGLPRNFRVVQRTVDIYLSEVPFTSVRFALKSHSRHGTPRHGDSALSVGVPLTDVQVGTGPRVFLVFRRSVQY
ncbi:hypothetical protein [Spelaeicoccus albus]|uniref:Uncharacterized protein n=1 Tax=Spelaeicoccus albus TaxID=1280376 RepID=A0A7Z0A9Z1_9MICO|nr:hypothetical protein [Spelaeicoccus albus]NYI66288.1 hypothetical protein [Spelaeicoccus albus]